MAHSQVIVEAVAKLEVYFKDRLPPAARAKVDIKQLLNDESGYDIAEYLYELGPLFLDTALGEDLSNKVGKAIYPAYVAFGLV